MTPTRRLCRLLVTAALAALLLAACLLLDHLGLGETASRIRSAVRAVVTRGEKVTGDLGGSASTTEFSAAVVDEMQGHGATI